MNPHLFCLSTHLSILLLKMNQEKWTNYQFQVTRAECFPLAKSRLTLAPLIHILLLDICRVPQLYFCLPQSSAWFISHSIFKLYLYLSQLISFIWFMQAEFKEQWKKD